MGKKKHEDHENHERWLVSYADFMTLMFAFFVVLWSQTKTDQKKLDALQDAMQAAFEGTPIKAVGVETALQQDDEETSAGHAQAPPEATVRSFTAASNPRLEAVRARLQVSFSDNVLQLGLIDNTLLVALNETVLFESGSASIHPTAYFSLGELAKALQDESVILDVLGHADGTPMSAEPFGDNFGLAMARAVATVRFLTARGVDAEQLTAAAELVHEENPARRSVTLKIRGREAATSSGILDKVIP